VHVKALLSSVQYVTQVACIVMSQGGTKTARPFLKRLYSYPVSEMTYTVSSGTLNTSIPYHTILYSYWHFMQLMCLIAKTTLQANYPFLSNYFRFSICFAVVLL